VVLQKEKYPCETLFCEWSNNTNI